MGARDGEALRARSCGSPAKRTTRTRPQALAAGGGRLRRARPALRRARGRCSRLGRAQRRLRKWGAARGSLEQAAAAFDELGSPGWADEARSELARVGARRPQPSGELTPTERRVAELAAEGLANKEIARTLFVTVHTVEVHLSHAYAKLGVRSAPQLALVVSPKR